MREIIGHVSVSTPSAYPFNSAPSAFTLSLPSNNEIVGQKRPTFSWNAATDSDLIYGDSLIYTVYYSTSPGVTGTVTQLNPVPALTTIPGTDLIEDATYYWKVKVNDIEGASSFSSDVRVVRINSINSAPNVFNLLGPANGSIVTTATPTLSWDISIDVDPGDIVRYSVEYSKNSNFVPISSSAWQYSRTFTMPALDENATYYWRVRSWDGLASTLCYAPFYLRVNAVPEKPLAFNLEYPLNNTRFTSNLISFVWDKTTDPDPAINEQVKYKVSYSLFSDFASSTTLPSLTGNTTSLIVPFDNHKYYWQVDAIGPDGLIRTSNQRLMFYTDAVKELPVWSAYDLLSPTGSIKITNTLTPLFTWNVATDADPTDTIRYFLQYSVDPTFNGTPSIPVGTDTYYQPLSDSPLLDQATYYWRVRTSGFDQSIPPQQVDTGFTFSSVGVFTISMTNHAPNKFSLISPQNGSQVNTKTPSFSWAQSTDIDLNDYVRYTSYISSVSNFTCIYYTTTSLSSTSFVLPVSKRLLENKTYYWKVVSNDRKGLKTICNSTFTFTLPILNTPTAPVGIRGILADNEQSFTMYWSTVVKNDDGTVIDDLGSYKIYRGLSLSSIDYNNCIARMPLGPNTWTDTTIQGGKFYYVIHAVDTSGIESSNSMILQSLDADKLNIMSSDNEALIITPSSVSSGLLAENNQWHKNLSLNIIRKQGSEADNILRDYDIKIMDNELNEITDFKFNSPLTIEFNYSTIPPVIARKNATSLSFNAKNLSVYWNNGIEYIKAGGYTDEAKKKFIATAIKQGSFQLRQTNAAITFGIASLTPKKVFTPGVAPYEKMTFIVNNPSGDKVIGKIYDLKGEFVADIKAVSDATNTTVILEWDGAGVSKGVYLYQIEAEGKIVNGTIILAK
jgi:hypothetical protein